MILFQPNIFGIVSDNYSKKFSVNNWNGGVTSLKELRLPIPRNYYYLWNILTLLVL